MVVVNLPLLKDVHRSGDLPADLDADLDRILAHEVYGHAVPYLIAGHMSGRCADPLPHQAPVESCAIQRENKVRAELGLGPRTEYGLESLGLVQTFRTYRAQR
jgi:hypothetical protein